MHPRAPVSVSFRDRRTGQTTKPAMSRCCIAACLLGSEQNKEEEKNGVQVPTRPCISTLNVSNLPQAGSRGRRPPSQAHGAGRWAVTEHVSPPSVRLGTCARRRANKLLHFFKGTIRDTGGGDSASAAATPLYLRQRARHPRSSIGARTGAGRAPPRRAAQNGSEPRTPPGPSGPVKNKCVRAFRSTVPGATRPPQQH